MATAPVKAGYWLADSGNIGDISPTLFTHLFCAFADVDPVSYEVVIPDASSGEFADFSVMAKTKNPSVKTLLSIGGNDPEVLASMARSETLRQSFINSSIEVARKNNFDGLDLFWKHPASQSDMENLRTLLGEWLAYAKSDEAPKLLITAAAFSSPHQLKYPGLAMRELDWVNVMALDFTDALRQRQATGAPAALHDPSFEMSCGSELVKRLIRAGLVARKLVLVFPFYGYAWKLSNPEQNRLGDPADGPYHQPGYPADGLWTYAQIKKHLQNSTGAYPRFDGEVVTNYFHDKKLWVGFDGPSSIHAKTRWAKTQKGLLGYVAYSVGWDSAFPDCELSRTAFKGWDDTPVLLSTSGTIPNDT